jgi:hypothetical protein
VRKEENKIIRMVKNWRNPPTDGHPYFEKKIVIMPVAQMPEPRLRVAERAEEPVSVARKVIIKPFIPGNAVENKAYRPQIREVEQQAEQDIARLLKRENTDMELTRYLRARRAETESPAAPSTVRIDRPSSRPVSFVVQPRPAPSQPAIAPSNMQPRMVEIYAPTPKDFGQGLGNYLKKIDQAKPSPNVAPTRIREGVFDKLRRAEAKAADEVSSIVRVFSRKSHFDKELGGYLHHHHDSPVLVKAKGESGEPLLEIFRPKFRVPHVVDVDRQSFVPEIRSRKLKIMDPVQRQRPAVREEENAQRAQPMRIMDVAIRADRAMTAPILKSEVREVYRNPIRSAPVNKMPFGIKDDRPKRSEITIPSFAPRPRFSVDVRTTSEEERGKGLLMEKHTKVSSEADSVKSYMLSELKGVYNQE